MEQRILEFLARRNILARPDLLPHLLEQEEPLRLLAQALDHLEQRPVFLSRADLNLLLQGAVAGPAGEPPEELVAPLPAGPSEGNVIVGTIGPDVGALSELPAPSAASPASGSPGRRLAAPMPEWSRPKRRQDDGEGDEEEEEEPEDGTGSTDAESGTSGEPDSPSGVGERPTARIGLAAGFRALAKDVSPQLQVIRDVQVEIGREGKVGDFTKCFNDRLAKIRRMLRSRAELRSAVSVEYVLGKSITGETKIIGLVSDARESRSGGFILEVEDETGCLTAFVPPQLGELHVVKDEVVGLVGTVDQRHRLYVRSLLRPEIPTQRTPRRSTEPVAAAFLSDLHVGSRTFLKKSFLAFFDWLNGNSGDARDLAGRIKYLCLVGDIVDGIGVYPDQAKDLAVHQLQEQYELLASYLAYVPDHIQVIAIPGNHDAVRPSEPQPTFPPEIQRLFDSRVKFLGNPATVRLHGVEALLYHGRGMDSYIPALGLTYDKPIAAMKEMLARRHLAPIYGDRVPLAPERRDQLVIEEVPDIFVTGHVHAAQAVYYRNVLLANASTWQSQTNYQKIMNFTPDPAKALVVDLQKLEGRQVSFPT